MYRYLIRVFAITDKTELNGQLKHAITPTQTLRNGFL